MNGRSLRLNIGLKKKAFFEDKTPQLIKDMTEIKPNANFYSLDGISVHDNKSEKYQEYRRAWIEYPSKFIIRDFPMHIDIETTSCCNLRCTFCDKLPLLKKDQLGYMDFAIYKKIIDEGAEYKLWGIKLSYRGEPLLHKNIVEMVKYAVQKGVLDVYFNTHGMLLTESMSERLIDAGLSRISISVEGTDPVAFEKKRIGAKFHVILKNIETLLNLREKRSVSHPKVRVQTVLFHDMDIESYKTYWQSRCDEVAAVDYKDESKREEGMVHDWACPQLWQRMTIEWDGTVFPCNNDDLRFLSPGNVKEKTLYECWHDKNVETVRNFHRIGESHKVKDCNGCPWRTAQLRKLQAEGEGNSKGEI